MNKSHADFKLNDPKVITGWVMFDWANSSFALTIAAAIFPAYFQGVTAPVINPLGISMYNTTLFSLTVAVAYMLIAFVSPILSGIADSGGRRQVFLKFFTTLGAVACLSLFFFDGEEMTDGPMLALGVLGFLIGTMGFAGSLVFYNSYLPDIVTEDLYNRVSAKGFMMGYVGSVILLIINLIVITFPTWFGLPEEGTLAVRISFLTVGVWWLLFAQVAFRRLPKDDDKPMSLNILSKGYQEFNKVWQNVKQQPNLKRFLISFFFYSAGVHTVLALAALFADVEVEMGPSELIIVILLLQVLALVGAWLFANLSDRIGNKSGLMVMLILWMVVCVMAYFVNGKPQFYAMACAIGLVMGGVQSQSRATYSKLLPTGVKDTTSYFSFYDVLEKGATALGAFSFAFTGQLSGGMRVSTMALAVFFFIGIVVLIKVKIAHVSVVAD